MEYRLLVDLEVIEVLDAMPKRQRMRMLEQFNKLRASPERYSDAVEYDRVGRQVEINVFADCGIHYWIDFADRHVKVLAITAADRLP